MNKQVEITVNYKNAKVTVVLDVVTDYWGHYLNDIQFEVINGPYEGHQEFSDFLYTHHINTVLDAVDGCRT